jgi:hypothetical protein
LADALRFIWDRADADAPYYSADEVARWPPGVVDDLCGSGLLRLAANASCVRCDSCAADHVEEVSAGEFPPGTGIRAFIRCPEAGRVEVPLWRLRRWEVDLPGLVAALAQACATAGPSTEHIPGRLWLLGKSTWTGRPRQVFFARIVRQEDAPAVAQALRQNHKGVLFLPTEQSLRRWGQRHPILTVALDSVLTLEGKSLKLDRADVEARLEDILLDSKARRKLRTFKRARRAPSIECLTKALEDHNRAAMDCAEDSYLRTGTPTILPCPTQAELALLTGLSESTVCRAMRDPRAKELRIQRDLAENRDGRLLEKLRARGRHREP